MKNESSAIGIVMLLCTLIIPLLGSSFLLPCEGFDQLGLYKVLYWGILSLIYLFITFAQAKYN